MSASDLTRRPRQTDRCLASTCFHTSLSSFSHFSLPRSGRQMPPYVHATALPASPARRMVSLQQHRTRPRITASGTQHCHFRLHGRHARG